MSSVYYFWSVNKSLDCCLHRHIEETHIFGTVLSIKVDSINNNKVLLRERKRHTARPVASPWPGGGGVSTFGGGGATYLGRRRGTYLGWGVPALAGGYLPWLEGTYLGRGGGGVLALARVPILAGVYLLRLGEYPPLPGLLPSPILRMREVTMAIHNCVFVAKCEQ